MESINYADPDPRMLNRPRKLSQSSTNSSHSTSRESYASSTRAPSWSSATSFDSMDFINSRSSEFGQSRSSASSGRPSLHRSKPNEIFSALPGEVLELILDELKKLHLGKSADSCSTCWMRDLCSISLASRKWCKFARTSLYEDIQLNGPDSTSMKKRFKGCANPRLVLLRRSLRANRSIAVIVHTLKVPAVPEDTPVGVYHDLVASVVMACPNLERLVGLYPRYSHAFDRLFHALSTRRRLKRMDWMIEGASASTTQRPPTRPGTSQLTKGFPTMGSAQASLSPPTDILLPSQSSAFIELHLDWSHLTTLTIHTLPGGLLTPDNLISTTISYLPALQHLFLSSLPSAAFKDDGLLALPPLKTLSLSYLSGITSTGLSNFATRATSRSIQRLVLRHVNMDDMLALARVLSNLVYLENLAFVQSFPPQMPEDNFILLMPYLASNSLRKLHWDITSHPTCAIAADSILARSIAAKGFPALRILRAPNDPEGIFQVLCRPRDRVDLPGDRFRPVTPHARNRSDSSRSISQPPSPTSASGAVPKATFGPSFAPEPWLLAPATNLHQARLAAQARLEAAWRFPRFHVNVIDERGMLVDKFGLAGFMGTAESKIRYDLSPDPGARDENGGLIEIGDVTGDCGEKEGDMCNGRWNVHATPTDKKDKDRWWHVERGRWTGVEM